MPEAAIGLKSSKRKFYKLLDNLSSSTVHLQTERNAASTTSIQEPPSKRFRLLGKERPTTTPGNNARPTTAGARERPRSSIFSVSGGAKARPKSSISEKDAAATPPKQANFAPWSHEQFLSRLKTFSDFRLWSPKPPAINEVEWAKRGWSVVGRDTVGCKGGCEKRLLVKIAPEDGEEKDLEADEDAWWLGDVERELAEKYRGLIAEGHTEECLWRKRGCEDDIYRIKMTDAAVWQTELRERYLSLLAIEPSLPAKLDLDLAGVETKAFNIDELAKLIPASILRKPEATPAIENAENRPPASEDDNASNEPAKDINNTALAMALLGWHGQSQNNVKLAYCDKCFQRAGLWLYSKSDEEMLFNPIDQHREHCPWKNPDSQRGIGRLEGLAGWQVLVSLIKGYQRHDRTPKKPARPVSMYAGQGDPFEDETPRKSKEEQAEEDKERKGRLQRLKRAFTVKKGSRKSIG